MRLRPDTWLTTARPKHLNGVTRKGCLWSYACQRERRRSGEPHSPGTDRAASPRRRRSHRPRGAPDRAVAVVVPAEWPEFMTPPQIPGRSAYPLRLSPVCAWPARSGARASPRPERARRAPAGTAAGTRSPRPPPMPMRAGPPSPPPARRGTRGRLDPPSAVARRRSPQVDAQRGQRHLVPQRREPAASASRGRPRGVPAPTRSPPRRRSRRRLREQAPAPEPRWRAGWPPARRGRRPPRWRRRTWLLRAVTRPTPATSSMSPVEGVGRDPQHQPAAGVARLLLRDEPAGGRGRGPDLPGAATGSPTSTVSCAVRTSSRLTPPSGTPGIWACAVAADGLRSHGAAAVVVELPCRRPRAGRRARIRRGDGRGVAGCAATALHERQRGNQHREHDSRPDQHRPAPEPRPHHHHRLLALMSPPGRAAGRGGLAVRGHDPVTAPCGPNAALTRPERETHPARTRDSPCRRETHRVETRDSPVGCEPTRESRVWTGRVSRLDRASLAFRQGETPVSTQRDAAPVR